MEWKAVAPRDPEIGLPSESLYNNCVEIYLAASNERWVTEGAPNLREAIEDFVQQYDLTDIRGSRVEVTQYSNGEPVAGREYNL